MSEKLIPIVSVVGPTASGKTEFAVNLALKFGGEIISADSMQIYREFEISTAKPTSVQLNAVHHYMIDILSVVEEFSVAKFTKIAHEYIMKIYNQGSIPFVVGGTGLYVDSLLNHTNFESDSGTDSSKTIFNDKDFQNFSNENLMSILLSVDPISAEKIHINDTKRLRRAVEFFYTTGYPISVQTQRSREIKSPYRICKIGLNFKNRELLYYRINERVDKMFESGIIEEVKKLSVLEISKTAKAAIGYKELLPLIMGKCTESEAKENLKKATRRYAKRQITWFKRDKEINWIYCDEYICFSEIINKAVDIINNFRMS